jgi:omega-hydroxy-beta-dihydromenaquinone-9 sulfotransferase
MANSRNFLVQHFGPACLAGITCSDWAALLAENGFRVSPQYLGKAAFLSVSSLCTSACRLLEEAMYRKQLASHQMPAPVFILGSWRSGTTHLHNILSLDDQFVSPNLFQTMYPHTFLVSESWLRPLLDLMTPKKRFMDNMDMGLREPAEDEMALAILSLRSNMLSWTFPRNATRYDRFLDFRDVPDSDRQLWKQHLDRFVRKVTLRNGKQPLLKSPNHTARIRLILELYPNAKFIHLRRNPYDVYRSLVHMASQVIPVWGLQTYPIETISDMAVDMYRRLYAAYFEQVSLIPAGQFHEVAYEDMIRTPVPVLEQTYQALNLGDFELRRSAIEAYTITKASYQKNRHKEIPAAICEQLHSKWRQSFDAWDYPRAETSNAAAGNIAP